MPPCVGMGEVIDDLDDETTKLALLFCMEYMICPKDLVRFLELYDAFYAQGEPVQQAVRDLADKIAESADTTAFMTMRDYSKSAVLQNIFKSPKTASPKIAGKRSKSPGKSKKLKK